MRPFAWLWRTPLRRLFRNPRGRLYCWYVYQVDPVIACRKER